VAVAVVAIGLSCVPSAQAAVRVKHDKANETRFVLKGRSLTVTVVDLPRYQQFPSTLSRLRGHDVRVACGASFRDYSRRAIATDVARWPAEGRSVTFTLSRDISRSAKWCVIEQRDDSGDVASVSFHRAEPRRLLTRGRFADGSGWRLFAWRGEMLEPCLSLRTGDEASGICLAEVAETGEGVEGHFLVTRCGGPTFLLGAVSRAAVRVEARMSNGGTVETELLKRPSGSRVRAQYFFATVADPLNLRGVIAYGASGEVIARERGISGSGPCPIDQAPRGSR
jgi:hypothetical protein